MSERNLHQQIIDFCDMAVPIVQPAVSEEIRAVRERLAGPLRVAIAGRVKAGKSTLLNALVGERLAATDAAECTKIVTWYRRGSGYEVSAFKHDGSTHALQFLTDEGRLQLDMDGQNIDDIERIEVEWPSSRLAEQTLIDTPGLGSVNTEVSARTAAFLALDEGRPGAADVVVYLMRHLHQTDAEFLEAFRDTWVAGTSPVNAIGVLSRADEVGSGRPDAMASAGLIARRNARSEQLSTLVSDVVAVAGLVAETGATLQEHEVASLRTLTREAPDVLRGMLISVDRFREPGASVLTSEIREQLLHRFGMFGLRLAIDAIREGKASTATDLASFLRNESGIAKLETLIRSNFGARAERLKARSAVLQLRRTIEVLGESAPGELRRGLEQIEAGAHELSELRALHMIATGVVEVDEELRAECDRLFSEGPVAERLGASEPEDTAAMVTLAAAGATRWRERSANPLGSRELAYVADVAARSYEGLYAALT